MKKIHLFLVFLLCFVACKKDNISQNQESIDLGKTITYNLKNGGKVSVFINKKGEYIVGGDVILSAEQIAFLNANRIGSKDGPSTESTFTNEFQKLWPGGIVYYTINDASNSTTINNAIAHWQANTPIRFIQRTNQNNYVNFSGQPDQGAGDSQLGMVGGAQAIRLVTDASLRTVIHEIGHAVGLMHEQTRNDRDTYVNINYSNINKDWKYQYDTYDIQGRGGTQVGAFDFESIMLYASYVPAAAYPGNLAPQITKKDGTTYFNFKETLSQGDINGVKALYVPVYFKINVGEGEVFEYDDWNDIHDEFPYLTFYSDKAKTKPIAMPKATKFTVKYDRVEFTVSEQAQKYRIEEVVTVPLGSTKFYLKKLEIRIRYNGSMGIQAGSSYDSLYGVTMQGFGQDVTYY